MKAIAQGEIHISGSDRRDLLNRVADDTDAVFIEGRDENIGGRQLTFGYMTFLIGIILLLWGQGAISRKSGPGVKDIIREKGIQICDKIDRGYPELYEDYPRWLKIVLGIVTVPLFLGALIMPADLQVVEFSGISVNYTFVIRFLFLASPILGYAVIYIVLEGWIIGARDDVMANNIMETCSKKGYDDIVISCGQQHLKPIVDELESNGWTVEPFDTNYTVIARIFRAPLLESEYK